MKLNASTRTRRRAIVLAAFAAANAIPALAQTPESAGSRTPLTLGVDAVHIEVGRLSDTPAASSLYAVRATPYFAWQPSRQWELRAGARLAADEQSGGNTKSRDSAVDLADTYVRYRSGNTRLTLGNQTVVWGRVDAVPVIDRISRHDLRRFLLDDLPDRRMAQPMIRWEQSLDEIKFDLAVLPSAARARLSDSSSVWYPIDRAAGRVLGLPDSPLVAAFARSAPLRTERRGFGGVAVRTTRSTDGLDLGLTFARSRELLPYFRLDRAATALVITQPLVPFVGLDAEIAGESAVFRTELGYTRRQWKTGVDGTPVRTDSVEWVGAVEFFPGGKDTRVNLQLVARHLRAEQPVLELGNYIGINGEIQSVVAQGRWRLGLRYSSGLNVHDLYLSPRLSFVGWEPHELYIAIHHFRGEDRTLGGFNREHGFVSIGLKSRF